MLEVSPFENRSGKIRSPEIGVGEDVLREVGLLEVSPHELRSPGMIGGSVFPFGIFSAAQHMLRHRQVLPEQLSQRGEPAKTGFINEPRPSRDKSREPDGDECEQPPSYPAQYGQDLPFYGVLPGFRRVLDLGARQLGS